MNKVILMGRLVADPEFSTGQSGTAVCRFRIAVDRSYAKQGEEKQSDFLHIVTFGKTAEFVNKYFKKGKPILVEGKIQNNNYTDNNGVQHYQDAIIADNISFLLSDPTRNNSSQQNTQPAYQNYQPQSRQNNTYQQKQPFSNDFMDFEGVF